MPQLDPPELVPGDNGPAADADLTHLTQSEEILSKPAYKKTRAKMRVFFDAYTQTGLVKQACKVAGISRELHYHKLETDPAYRRAFEKAQEQVGDMLEDLAVQRVREGTRKLVLYQGEPVAVAGELLYEISYDHHLHTTLLKRFKPDQYREKTSLEVSGSISLTQRMEEANQRLVEMYPDAA